MKMKNILPFPWDVDSADNLLFTSGFSSLKLLSDPVTVTHMKKCIGKKNNL